MAERRRPSSKQAAHAERAERLAAALRENLKRRKVQARGRASKVDVAEKKKTNPDSDMGGA
jgi:hypothetical protein